MFTYLLCFYVYRCLHMYCIAMYVDVYMFMLLLCKHMFTHLLNCYVYRYLHVYVIAIYTYVYTFIVLLHCDYRCL